MKTSNAFQMACVTFFVFAISLALAGVTEIKLYSNENPPTYYNKILVDKAHAAAELGISGDAPHVNSRVVKITMNRDINLSTVPPDSTRLWVTSEAAVGPYALNLHFANMPNPRCTMVIQEATTTGYADFLNASSTERITFWYKSAKGNSYPLWLTIRCAPGADGKRVDGAYICLAGETVVRMDVFGGYYAASLKPFTGDWQFVSLPWGFFKLATAAEIQAVVPYSHVDPQEGVVADHIGGSAFDISKLATLNFDTKKGGEHITPNYPWPGGVANAVGIGTYAIDEVVLTVNEGSGVTDVNGNQNVMPLTYDLGNNYPNPFNPTTSISYSVPVSNHVSLDVYNALGVKVRTLVNAKVSAGTYQAVWDGKDDLGNTVTSGIYFCKMQSSHFSATKKLTLMK